MKLQRFKEEKSLVPETKEVLALCFIAMAGIQGVILIILFFLAIRVNAEATKKVTQVQLINGTTYYVSEKDRYWRYPPVITSFVKQWTQMTFYWNNRIPGTNDSDKGISIGNKKVPTSSYFASLLMEPQFGKATLQQLTEIIPSEVFSGNAQATVIVSYTSEPRQVRPNEWDVDVIATRVVVNQRSGRDERIPFNKTFRIKAVEIQNSTFETDSSPFERKVYELRSAGLEIQKITDFVPPQ